MARKKSSSGSRAGEAAEALGAEIRNDRPQDRQTGRPVGVITSEERRDWEAWASAQAQDSFRKGEACLSGGDMAGALGWLERAHRMAADSPNVALLLALARQGCGHRLAAIPLLESLTERYDSGQIWLMLATVRLQEGQTLAARTALEKMLATTVCTDELHRRVMPVAAALGLDNWCALDARGGLRFGRPLSDPPSGAGRKRRKADASLSVLADGLPCPAGWDRQGLLTLDIDDSQWNSRGDFWSIGRLEVRLDGRPLAGSPLQPARAMRTEGFVTASETGLAGWVWHPGSPDSPPVIHIHNDVTGDLCLTVEAAALSPEVSNAVPLARFREINVPWKALPDGPVRVRDERGKDLAGSPLDPGLERRAARWALERARLASLGEAAADTAGTLGEAPPFQPVPVTTTPLSGPSSSLAGSPAGAPDTAVLIVVPVYRDVPRTRACLESLLATLPKASRTSPRVLLVDDAAPEEAMRALLEEFARDPRVSLHVNTENRGFVVSANLGLRAALSQRPKARDVVLLNSDTLVSGAWLDELRAVAHSAPDIGTVTPLSNDATIMSYPDLSGNPPPSMAWTTRQMRLARQANEGMAVEVPTGHGFCLYIRHDCLRQTGLLRADLFAQGYGEENDFCLRARLLGWRSVAAPGAYVAHMGSASFGGATRAALLARNLALLNRLHPGYDALIGAHVAADPLFEARRRIDVLRWRQDRRKKAGEGGRDEHGAERGGAVLLVTHDYGGGVERVVQERARRLERDGFRPVLIRPVRNGCRIEGRGGEASYPNLRFRLPEEWPRLLRLLTAERLAHVEWHHASGHHMAMRELTEVLGVPYDVYMHDYIWFCPRISLMGPSGGYCGEPGTDICETCVAMLGRRVDDDLPVADYVARSARELAGARSVIAPSPDAARRLGRHFPKIPIRVEPLEDDRPDLSLAEFSRQPASPASAFPVGPVIGPPRTPGRFRVCVVGAIGQEKGYDILLAAAREARDKGRPIEYVVVGHTPDDAALMETGHVHVTGFYREAEAVALIRACQPDYGLIPSVWPETWCFALGVAWLAGMNVASFDLGAVADRIRATGRGYILPLGISAERLNVVLISLCQKSDGKVFRESIGS